MQVINETERYDAVLQTTFATLGLLFDNDVLIRVDYLESDSPVYKPNNKTINYVCQQIEDYCSGKLKDNHFDIDVRITGTAFQLKVWRQLQKIAYGQVRTYGEIAKILKTSPRAVGNACRANPVVLLVPCHRVISARGTGGYSGERDGQMVKIKQWLLDHEKTQSGL